MENFEKKKKFILICKVVASSLNGIAQKQRRLEILLANISWKSSSNVQMDGDANILYVIGIRCGLLSGRQAKRPEKIQNNWCYYKANKTENGN